jgi:hypothetical protein
MKSLTLTKKLPALAAASILLATTPSRAQQIYLNTFNTDDSSNWVVNFSYTAGPIFASISNSLVNFNFDYTTAGIPIAPHSAQFGSDIIHHGLKMSACYTNTATLKTGAFTSGLSAAPTNFGVSDNFIMHADMWMNVDCTPYATLETNNVSGASYATTSHNTTASTVFYGCGYGTVATNATTPGLTDAIWVGALTDNGVLQQYRMYGPSAIGESSYQDGVYQSTGTTIPGFPGDPYVYNIGNQSVVANNGAGCREAINSTANPPWAANLLATNIATGVPWATIFPPSVVPLAQQILYPQQTNNASCPGLLTFAWHDVSVEKVGNVIVYKVDGNIIATGNYSSAGTPPGNFLTFVATRTGTSVASTASATGPIYTNLNFVVFANVVVSNYNNIVNVSAQTATTSEDTPGSPGVITLKRASAGVPLTVNYTLSGTAAYGTQYTIGAGATSTNVTFSSTATSTNISIVPIDDGVPNPTTQVILTLQSGGGYAGAGSAIVNILDADPTTVDITSGSQAYGRYTNTAGPYYDFINYNLTRRGKLTTGSDLTVNLSYSGSAVSGTDYTPVSTITIPDGQPAPTALNPNAVAGLQIIPLDNPNALGNRTVVVTLAPGTGYTLGNSSATGTVVSAHYPAAPVLLSDDLTSSIAPETNNWKITYGCGDPLNNSTNYATDFGMSLGSAAGGFPVGTPPGGNPSALHLTCNKLFNTGGAAGAVNVYYTNLWLDGDYAVRFNMNLIEGRTTATATEGAVFGINHSGSLSNWWAGSGFVTNYNWASDGVWFYITAQPAGSTLGDYQIFTGLGGTNGNTGWAHPLHLKNQFSFAQAFKDTPGPFTCLDGLGTQTPGVPANGSPSFPYDTSTWSDVEIRQQNNIVTMSINHTPIYVYTNTTVWTGGYLMLGYADPFGDSTGSPEAGVYYANLQVVSLQSTPILITGIAINGGNVVITFLTQTASDTTSSFTLRSSGALGAPFSDVSPAASITSIGVNEFQATTPYLGGTQLYRIHHN